MKKGIPEPLKDAISFLTVIPLPCPLVSKEAAGRMKQALAWFPFIGGLVGGLGGGIIFLASSWVPASIAALLGFLGMAVLTGGLHLDGFSDTVDGFSVPGGKEEILRVMGDSRIGAIGAIGLFILLGLKWALIQEIPTDQSIAALVAACCLGRWAMVISAQSFPYVPGKVGLGRLVTDSNANGSVFFASMIGLGLVLAAVSNPGKAFLLIGLAGGALFFMNRFFVGRLGGITGDTLGAVNETIEVLVLLFWVAQGHAG